MPDITLLDLTTQARAIGRGVVLYATASADAEDRTPVKWDGASELHLKHLGDTEGEISVDLNEQYSHLELGELTGGAKHRSYVSGEDPVVNIPLFYADPALRAIVSPTGNASGGYQRRRPVRELTLVIMPEEVFFNAETDAYEAISYDGTDWTVGEEDELTDRQVELLALSMWFWRGYFTKAGPVFRHEDGGKAVQEVSFQVMQSDLPLDVIPDGQRLYTLGDPGAVDINLSPEEVTPG
jgi:hypothetical protein